MRARARAGLDTLLTLSQISSLCQLETLYYRPLCQ